MTVCIHGYDPRIFCVKCANEWPNPIDELAKEAGLAHEFKERIHAICHAYGILKSTSVSLKLNEDALADRIIDAERATRQLK